MVPEGVNKFSARVWWLFHYLRLFASRQYGIFLIYDNEKLIHRAFIFPRYFRFPFMSNNDLQIGDTFTDPDYRGKGLATFAIQEIAKKYGENRKIWYLVACDNTASICAIEKTGFTCVGAGEKIKRFGFSVFGYYDIKDYKNN
jgi:GNAT superfamily N-acetyltransferase